MAPRLAAARRRVYVAEVMRTGPASRRRSEGPRRRNQIQRRRLIALAVFVTLIVAAVWAAYAIPQEVPGQVPQSAALPAADASPGDAGQVVVATVDGVDIVLPVARNVTTAVAYHPVDYQDTVPFTPAGERLGGGGLGQALADVFAGGGGVQYYLMDGTGAQSSPATSGLDVGAVPGSAVVSPVDGKVTAIKPYLILGRYADVEIDIQLARDPSLLLVVTHVAKPQVVLGDVVARGESVLGEVRGLPASLDQALSQHTSDTGDHVQLMVLRVTPEIAGF
jgi:hypothetical protein